MLEHWPRGPKLGPPKFDGNPFLRALGPIQGHKVQHLLVTWGQIEKFFFSLSALTPSVKALSRAGFNFCTNRNAGIGLNIGPDS